MSTATLHADTPVNLLKADLTSVVRARQAARASGLDPARDGLARLEQEHDRITEAMQAAVQAAEQYQTTQSQGQAGEVNRLTDQLVQLVVQHASLEERFVYPLFRTHLKGTVQGVSADMIYERNVVDDDMNKRILDLLMQMRMERDGELMRATLRKFQVIEEEHMTQEEHWFSLLRSQMASSDLAKLAESMSTALTPSRPHSIIGPSHGLGAQLTHAVVSVLDKAMDKVQGRQPIVEGAGGVKRADLEGGHDKSIGGTFGSEAASQPSKI